MGDDIGEIDLALVVVRAQGRQGGAQVGGVEDVDAGVDLADSALGLAGVALLDDGGSLRIVSSGVQCLPRPKDPARTR